MERCGREKGLRAEFVLTASYTLPSSSTTRTGTLSSGKAILPSCGTSRSIGKVTGLSSATYSGKYTSTPPLFSTSVGRFGSPLSDHALMSGSPARSVPPFPAPECARLSCPWQDCAGTARGRQQTKPAHDAQSCRCSGRTVPLDWSRAVKAGASFPSHAPRPVNGPRFVGAVIMFRWDTRKR